MAEPARKISSPNLQAANDNASSLRGASLRVLQGGRSEVVRKNRNQPSLHPLSQMQLARDLEESKERDRSAGSGDSSVSDDTLKAQGEESDGSLLDLKTRSYANRDESSQEMEVERQREQARVASRFLYPDARGASGGASIAQPAPEERMGSMRKRSSAQSPAVEADQQQAAMAGALLADRRRSVMLQAAEQDAEKMKDAQQTVNETQRFWSLITKIIELESVILAIWVFIALNIETLNILIFRVKAPAWINTMLSKIGLNLDVDPKRPFTPITMTIVGVTLFVDLLLFLMVLVQVALFLFMFAWYFLPFLGAAGVLKYFGISF